ncbi:Gmad2 immunoglobulin-like domain-containing protein [Brevibacillus sp. 179-C 1.1 NHS]|uniref:Gmad2 immunoglobulin-like domain-containing protein n=1 Tax=Brevibacillus sp. 179-C 1.1 NHS TaxID=3235177 RepID=UPI0039A381D3
MRLRSKMLTTCMLAISLTTVSFPTIIPPAAAHVHSHPVGEDKGRYENESFRNITITKTGEGQYTIKGEARVNEANVRFVVTDKDKTLANSFVTASMGAPEWGSFSIDLKLDPNAKSPVLALFEESAATGQRIHELRVPLPK